MKKVVILLASLGLFAVLAMTAIRAVRCSIAADLIKPGMSQKEVEQILPEQAIRVECLTGYTFSYLESGISVYFAPDVNDEWRVVTVTKEPRHIIDFVHMPW